MWRDNDVRTHGEGSKQLINPIVGKITFEYSSFAVDGQSGLGMVVYNPATPEDVAKVKALLKAKARAKLAAE